MSSKHRISGTLRAAWLLAILVPAAALALITQGYHYTGTPLDGGLVALDPANPQAVVLASSQTAGRLAGVMVPPGSSEITISQAGQVQVASSGTVPVDVSDENGPIQKGDYVSVSSLAGVGAKAVKSGLVLGVAQTGFSGHESGAAQATVAGRSVAVGQIPVALYIGNASLSMGDSSAQVPAALERLASAVAGHQVSAVRLILAALILVGGLLGIAVILYGAVSNSFLSIGRNPLASHSIYRGLLQVSGVALVILAICIAAMYVVVRA